MAELPFNKAADNNKGPILEILREVLADSRSVLEIGSGTGQHAVWFAQNLPHLTWQPSEHPDHLDELRPRLDAQAPGNIRPPIALDVADCPWPVANLDAVYSANCVHIMSWDHVCEMFKGLAQAMASDGLLVLYGPFKYSGAFTTPSNEKFDFWLKERDPLSGIRAFEEVDELARAIGLELQSDTAMPANNQLLVWQRRN